MFSHLNVTRVANIKTKTTVGYNSLESNQILRKQEPGSLEISL